MKRSERRIASMSLGLYLVLAVTIVFFTGFGMLPAGFIIVPLLLLAAAAAGIWVGMTRGIPVAVPGSQKTVELCHQRPEIGMAIFRTTTEVVLDRYRSTLERHLQGVAGALQQPETWTNA